MTLGQLIADQNIKVLNSSPDGEREVTGGICCDLLSWVMAKGEAGMAWITVQTHLNVVAVASLHEFTCIVLAEGAVMPAEVLEKAAAEGIAVLGSRLPAYKLCGLLHELGVR